MVSSASHVLLGVQVTKVLGWAHTLQLRLLNSASCKVKRGFKMIPCFKRSPGERAGGLTSMWPPSAVSSSLIPLRTSSGMTCTAATMPHRRSDRMGGDIVSSHRFAWRAAWPNAFSFEKKSEQNRTFKVVSQQNRILERRRKIVRVRLTTDRPTDRHTGVELKPSEPDRTSLTYQEPLPSGPGMGP